VEHMIGVDLFVRNRIRLRCFRRTGVTLSLVDGSSCDPNTVQRVARILARNKLDVLFIDGDHSYEGVLADFLSYRHLVRDGGLIAFHDIQPDGRDQGETVAYSGGVPVFWSQLRDHYPAQEFISLPQSQRGMGIGCIRYSSSIQIPEALSPSA
jgi:cephalosporin hydroxylase